ncbi:MAG TPA: hypothetical protein PLH39_07775 [Promineifilum sp.]|nr:hypothetical protein [Promineifilum sp.]
MDTKSLPELVQQLPPDAQEVVRDLVELLLARPKAEATPQSPRFLLQAARMRVPEDRAKRMQELVWKQQSEGLTAVEEDEAAQLQQFARRVMLVRADAAALLAARGHDVAGLISQAVP